MAENKQTTTVTKSKSVHGAGWLLNLIGFIAVICVGISLLLSQFKFMGKVAGALSIIAQYISYIILILLSLFFIVRQRKIWLWVTWGIAVTMIVVSFFLGIF